MLFNPNFVVVVVVILRLCLPCLHYFLNSVLTKENTGESGPEGSFYRIAESGIHTLPGLGNALT